MADSANTQPPTGDEPVDPADAIERNLRFALTADEDPKKNYFIRTALQFVELQQD